MLEDPTDASRRTRLASERTFLAWLRGGLAAIAVGIGAGSVVPGVSNVKAWPYIALGIGYVLLGVFLLVYGVARYRALDAALDKGRYSPLERRGALALTAFAVALGVLTVVVLITTA
jgi:putative membrane protein